MKILALFLLLVATIPAFGQDVRWDQPKLEFSIKRGESRVVLRGTTTPGATITIAVKKLFAVNSETNEVTVINTEGALPAGSVFEADATGAFSIPLILPHRAIQLPLLVRDPNTKESKPYQLNISVNDLSMTFTDIQVMQQYSNFKKHHQLWFGLGFNYLNYAQESSDVDLDLDFYNYSFPTGVIDWIVWLREDLEFNLTAKYSPTEIKGVSDTEIENNEFGWFHTALESTYYPRSGVFRWRNLQSQIGLRYGMQHHQLPMLEREDASNTEFSINEIPLTTAAVGFKLVATTSVNWALEWLFKYQYPLLTDSDVTPRLDFDGSLGVIWFNAYREWNLGFYWYGQYHSFDFKTEDDIANEKISGSEELLYSRLELRLGRSF